MLDRCSLLHTIRKRSVDWQWCFNGTVGSSNCNETDENNESIVVQHINSTADAYLIGDSF